MKAFIDCSLAVAKHDIACCTPNEATGHTQGTYPTPHPYTSLSLSCVKKIRFASLAATTSWNCGIGVPCLTVGCSLFIDIGTNKVGEAVFDGQTGTEYGE